MAAYVPTAKTIANPLIIKARLAWRRMFLALSATTPQTNDPNPKAKNKTYKMERIKRIILASD